MSGLRCSCGSDLEYFDCCYKKHSSEWAVRKYTDSLIKFLDNNNAKGKCMFPGCDRKAIASHTISKSNGLDKIYHKSEKSSELNNNKSVIYPSSIRNMMGKGCFDHEESTGKATCYHLFCGPEKGFLGHDSVLFGLVDNPDSATESQQAEILYMASYRAICGRIKHKSSMLNSIRKNIREEYHLSGIESGLSRSEIEHIYETIRKAMGFIEEHEESSIEKLNILKIYMEKYIRVDGGGVYVLRNDVSHFNLTSEENKPIPILVSSADFVFDDSGKIGAYCLNTILNKGKWSLALTIFPEEDGFGRYAENLFNGDLSKRENFYSLSISIILISISLHDNIAFAKKWVDSLSDYDKETLIMLEAVGREGGDVVNEMQKILYERKIPSDVWFDSYEILGDDQYKKLLKWGAVSKCEIIKHRTKRFLMALLGLRPPKLTLKWKD